MKKLVDMAYSQNENCWYTCTKFSSSKQSSRRGGGSGRPPTYTEISRSVSQIVALIDMNHRKQILTKLRTNLTVNDTLELINFCPDVANLHLYTQHDINVVRARQRVHAVTGFFSRPLKGFSSGNKSDGSSGSGSDSAETRLTHVVKLFFRAVSDIKPIVWAFEDLQFAPSESLTLIESMLNDQQINNSNLIFVGIIRQDKIKKRSTNTKNKKKRSDHQFFQKWVDEKLYDPIQLSMTNMTKDQIAAMLRDVLRSDNVEDLAELMYQRTNGNDYFVLQLFGYLQEEDLITFSTWTYQWQWDIDEIKRKSMVADNVLASVEKRLFGLPRPVQRCLHIAAHLGYRFDEDLLAKVMRAQFILQAEEMKNSTGKTHELLQVGLDGNFIERIDMDEGKLRYKFVHSEVQFACQKLFEGKGTKQTVQKLHWNIGAALWRGWRENETYECVPNRVIFPCVSVDLSDWKKCMLGGLLKCRKSLTHSFVFKYVEFTNRLKKLT